MIDRAERTANRSEDRLAERPQRLARRGRSADERRVRSPDVCFDRCRLAQRYPPRSTLGWNDVGEIVGLVPWLRRVSGIEATIVDELDEGCASGEPRLHGVDRQRCIALAKRRARTAELALASLDALCQRTDRVGVARIRGGVTAARELHAQRS